ncbi:caspase family protein [Runella sp. MFBS21]|uniref:caspase family protein n=1 Tax=Runella sp. MFBS21 TaxID=3034018 RepID=UPI0023F7C7C9|nr:caspase family protein [Runella sp. MFBS21]MDF7821806.1 caspase family protein [Runella sp. MFBS21]
MRTYFTLNRYFIWMIIWINTLSNTNAQLYVNTINLEKITWELPVITGENIVENDRQDVRIVVLAHCDAPLEKKDFKVWVDGNIVLIDEASCDKNRFETNLKIDNNSDHTLYVTVTKGSTTKQTSTLTLTSFSKKRIALVVGNSEYQNSTSLQQRPVNDALDISKKLKSLNFEVITVVNVTKPQIEHAIREFSKKGQSCETALFFYAGHGIESEGINYLLPIEAKLDAPEDARFEAISLDFLLSEMRRFKTKINLVYLDACRNNPFRSWSRDIAARGFRAVERTPPTMKVYYATQPGDIASNGTGRNGVFTQAILENLRAGVDIEVLMREVTKTVYRLTNGTQTPWSAGSLIQEFKF